MESSGDVIIADFIGKRLPKSSYSDGNQWTFDFCAGFYPTLKTMRFRDSWAWLMPVVTKLLQHRFDDGDQMYLRTFGMQDSEGSYMVRFNRCPLHSHKELIVATYEAVVEFIKLQNENGTPDNGISGETPNLDGDGSDRHIRRKREYRKVRNSSVGDGKETSRQGEGGVSQEQSST